MLGTPRMYGRFLRQLPGFLRQSIDLREAEATLRRRVAEREESFLRLARRGIFDHRESPYRALLQNAGCEYGDLETLVRSDGLDEALRKLRAAGVWVTFEQFKGRQPLERDGLSLRFDPHDFDNPFSSPVYQAESGGSTGAGTRVMIDLDHIRDKAISNLVNDSIHGMTGVPTAFWFGLCPITGWARS